MIKLDEVDRLILKKLQENARRSFKEIAKEAGVSEATIFVRVKKLQDSGVIKGFKAIVDHDLVGKKTTAFVLVKANPKEYPKVLEELVDIDDICEIHDVTGEYYAILKIKAENTDKLAKIIDKIGAISGVAGTETILVLKTIKEKLEVNL